MRRYRAALPGGARRLAALAAGERGAAGQAAHGRGRRSDDSLVAAAAKTEGWLSERLDTKIEKK